MKYVYYLASKIDEIDHCDITSHFDIFTGLGHECAETQLEGKDVTLLCCLISKKVATSGELHQNQYWNNCCLYNIIRVALQNNSLFNFVTTLTVLNFIFNFHGSFIFNKILILTLTIVNDLINIKVFQMFTWPIFNWKYIHFIIILTWKLWTEIWIFFGIRLIYFITIHQLNPSLLLD